MPPKGKQPDQDQKKLEEQRIKEEKAKLQEKLEIKRQQHEAEMNWHRYLLCDGLPNPIIDTEINTYMSLWRMNETRISMEEVMLDSIDAMKLIDELQTLIADLDDEYKDRQRYRDIMQELRELVQEKVDRACVETLSKAVHFADKETANLQRTWGNNWLSLCMWGNLSKNPRIKRYSFDKAGISFDIPKFLTLSECAFRIVFMKFDTYSVTSPSAVPKSVPRKPPSPPPEAPKKPRKTKSGDLAAKAEEKATPVNPFGMGDDEEEEEEEEEEEDEDALIPEEDRIPTPPPVDWEPCAMPEDAVDLCDFHVIGGVFQFDLLTLPRQPRTGRGWLITTCVVPPKLTPFDYVVDRPDDDEDEEEEEEEEEDTDAGEADEDGEEDEDEEEEAEEEGNKEELQGTEAQGAEGGGEAATAAVPASKVQGVLEKTEKKAEEKPPVKVKLRLPACLIIPEEPLLACWDPETMFWRTDGIVIDKFNKEKNEITFRAAVFGTLAVFQEYHMNMPFLNWELRPLPMKVVRREVPENDEATKKADPDADAKDAQTTEAVKGAAGGAGAAKAEQAPNPSAPGPVPPGDAAATNPQVFVGAKPADGNDKNAVAEDDGGFSNENMTLGPLPSMGIPDDLFLEGMTEANQCLLTITGAHIQVKLHILADRIAIITEPLGAVLDPNEEDEEAAEGADKQAKKEEDDSTEAKPQKKPPKRVPIELEHLAGRWFTPDELINVLQISGVNLFPRDDSSTRVECLEKNPLTEQWLYEQMALLSPAMSFSWSRWNAECQDPKNIIVCATEHLDEEGPVDEATIGVFSVNRHNVFKLRIKEYAETFDSTPDPKHKSHADFFHMYMEIGSETGKQRVRQIDSRHFKTVHRILKATRLAVFS
ncbi:Protein casc1 [Sparganum proliferum]